MASALSVTSSANESLPVYLCVLPDVMPNRPRPSAHATYITEILDHAGVPFHAIAPSALATLSNSRCRLLITVGEAQTDDATKTRFQQWLSAGGSWLSIGGTAGMAELLGVETIPSTVGFNSAFPVSTLGEGYLQPREARHPVIDHLQHPLHFFNGVRIREKSANVIASSLDAHQRRATSPALVEHTIGQGRSLLIAPDAVGTIVRIQQGIPIRRDGIPAPDGSAPIADGVLKSDDGMVLDWLFDRHAVEGDESFQAFTEPIADQWREIILRAIFHLAASQRIPLPLLWLYPRNLPALAHLSHDSDGNEDPLAREMLVQLERENIRSTWCTILPGHSPDVLRKVHESGHELAMHFNALDEGQPWSRENFIDQFKGLTHLFDDIAPTTNKNHYLRWENDVDLWHWCLECGISLDQTKGPSKTGAAGFLFGTCHPYFPLDRDGQPIDVLELPTLTQDLVIFAPPTLGVALLKSALASHGVLHMLFHQTHIAKPGVAESLQMVIRGAKERGMEWWTAAEINRWERARRTVSWLDYRADAKSLHVTVKSQQPLKDATVLWLIPESAPTARSRDRAPLQRINRWGQSFYAMTFDLPAGTTQSLDVDIVGNGSI